MALAMAIITVPYVLYLDFTVRTHFEGKRWELPARVYARPLELFQGMRLTPAALDAELSDLGYRRNARLDAAGQYSPGDNELRFVTRAFRFWDSAEPSRKVRVAFEGGAVHELQDFESGKTLDLVRLDPVLIGSIYPAHHEDRVLVQIGEVPPLLIKTLIAVEDRHYYRHYGVNPVSIARAMLANLRSGRAVQGGSTLTQQLVKNFYLTSERTWWRKLNEAIMALLLEAHYSKDEILEAYLNEVFLGQEGSRAIHGFSLASRFYFGQPLNELKLPQFALLVGMVRGPSYYDPRRHAERALALRSLVLDVLLDQQLITAEEARTAKAAPLGVIPRAPSGTSPYPAFMDLLRRQLKRDYKEEDLTSEGLQIFTTFDPRIQKNTEQALDARIAQLEKQYKIPAGRLEGAVVVARNDNGEVLAVAGGREARYSGFNRALDAQRPIGSLVKPAVYLTALSLPKRYTLATLLDDSPVTFNNPGGKPWAPQNYDLQNHGMVPLLGALAHSYNVSTARLGMEIGVPGVVRTMKRLGVMRDIAPFPSVLLGAVELTPIEVTQMYQTIASGGFRAPLRSIREVLTVKGEPLQRYPLSVEQVYEPAPVFLLTTALQQVVSAGTARSVIQQLPDGLTVAGKTGTTDDLRDSWFAGFSGQHLAVVWVGRDDNRPTGLSGASGALRVWGDIMGTIGADPLRLTPPASVELARVDLQTGLRAGPGCADAVELPFIEGSAPGEISPCADGGENSIERFFKRFFQAQPARSR
ncbi:MAG: penicillin-binding protein 1B [Gammaproteobacteria bacterium]|nr:MAG: penicillin-binding protein 1B [Gammaproteobacteria bacterium]